MLRLSLAARRATANAGRRYSTSRSEGSVAQSHGFKDKEKAVENQYMREQERKTLGKLRDEIERKKKELASLEKEHDEKLAGSK